MFYGFYILVLFSEDGSNVDQQGQEKPGPGLERGGASTLRLRLWLRVGVSFVKCDS